MAYSNEQPTLYIAEAIMIGGYWPTAGEGINTLGVVRSLAFGFAPSGMALANGQFLPINQFQGFHELLGTTYGGDGELNFALPNLRGRVVIGSDTDDLGDEFGSATTQVPQSSLPTIAGGNGDPNSNLQPAIAIHYLIGVSGSQLGQIIKYAGKLDAADFAGYVLADGRELTLSEETQALFDLIGNTYGGDPEAGTFRLPDLVGRNVVGTSDDLDLGETFGRSSLELDVDNLPAAMGGSSQPVDNRAPGIALHYIISLYGVFPDQSGGGVSTQPYVGEIRIFAGNSIPAGWALCDGSILRIADNETLFQLIGTTFGGDGQETFWLPDLSGRVPGQMGTGSDGISHMFSEYSGVESFTLTMSDIPALNIVGTEGNDTYIGTDHNDTIDGSGGNDAIDGGAGDDDLQGGDDDDSLSGGDGHDSLQGGNGNDVLEGGDGNDTLKGGAGNDSLMGGAGQDSIYGGDGNDTIIGSADGDAVVGGKGDDLFVIASRAAYLNSSFDGSAVDAATDTVRLMESGSYFVQTPISGVERFELAGDDGAWTFAFDSMIFYSAINGTIAFTATTALTHGVDLRISNPMVSTAGFSLNIDGRLWGGNDIVATTEGADTIYMGGGTDYIDAGQGNDTIIVTAAGQVSAGDTINGDSGTDTLLLDFSSTSATTTVNLASAGAVFSSIEKLKFVPGTGAAYTITLSGTQFGAGLSNALAVDLGANASGPSYLINVIDAADFSALDWTLNVSSGASVKLIITGTSGADRITGSAYSDSIVGGLGGDSISTGSGSDTIVVGAGDSIDAGLGADFFDVGSMADLAGTTIDAIAEGGNFDLMRLVAAGTYDFTSLASGAIKNIDIIELAPSPSAWSVTLGDDLVGTADSNFDGTYGDLQIKGDSVTSDGVLDASTLTGNNSIFFAYGENLTAAVTVKGGAGRDVIYGGAGADRLFGGAGNDTLQGNAGADSLVGALGADRFDMRGPSDLAGDTIDGGNADAAIDVLSLGAPGTYDFTGSTVTGIETLLLLTDSPDTGWEITLGNAFVAGSKTQSIKITTDSSPFQSGLGILIDASGLTAPNSVVVDGQFAGDDTLLGGAGNDTLLGVAGADSIDGGAGNDSLVGGAGNDTISFGTGSDTVAGGEDDDTIIVSAGGQVSSGDSIDGGNGDDTLVFDLDGYNLDVSAAGAVFHNIENILLSRESANRQLTLAASQFGSGLISDSVTITLDQAPSADTFYIWIKDAGVVFTVEDWTFDLGDGTVSLIISGTGIANTITGSDYADIIDGMGGGDSLFGGGGADSFTVYGGDTIFGGAGNDNFDASGAGALTGTVIDAGSGTNLLSIGGGGIFTFANVTGIDEIYLGTATTNYDITLTDAFVGDAQTYRGAGLAISPTTYLQNGAGLVIDGTALTAGHAFVAGGSFNLNSDTMLGGGGNDTLLGEDGADSLAGGAGDDSVVGGLGADILKGGAGADVFMAELASHLTGDVIDGGNDGTSLDTLRLYAAGAYNFTGSSIKAVEVLRLYDSAQGWDLTIGDGLVTGTENSRLYIAGHSSGATLTEGVRIDASGLTGSNALYVTEGKFGGNDVIVSGAGDDSLAGGAGIDLLNSGSGNDTLSGGEGNDTIAFGTGTDSVAGNNGDDSFTIRSGQVDATDTIDGGAGVDTLTVNFATGATTIDLSGAGAVFHNIEKFHLALWGADNRLVLSSDQFGSGLLSTSLTVTARDALGTSSGIYAVEVHGIDGAFSAAGFVLGNDTLGGLLPRLYLNGDGVNGLSITGSAHDDIIDAGGGTSVTLSGGNGNDTISGWGRTSDVDGGAGDDLFTILSAGRLHDSSIKGEAGTDTLRLDGNGTNLFSDADLISGIEVVALNSAQAGYFVVLNGGMAATADNSTVEVKSLVTTGYAATISASAFGAGEKLVMSGSGFSGGDTVYGGAGDDKISTGLGGDSVTAGGGNDTIDGGEGNDIINGGDGDDVVVLAGNWLDYTVSVDSGVYTIIDRRSGHSGTDTVSNFEFAKFAGGTFAIGALINTGPVAANDVSGTPAVVEGGNPTTTGSVLTNDTDANRTAGLGDVLSITQFRTGTEAAGGTFTTNAGSSLKGIYGTLRLRADGTYTYTLDNTDPHTKALGQNGSATDVFTYKVTDSRGATDVAQLSVSIQGTNSAPVIGSNGGGASASITISENSKAVTTVVATDADSAVSYSISGADAALFKINSSTGALAFLAAPDREAPADANHDNIYRVTVTATDGLLSDTQALAVTVANVNEAPRITSNGGTSSGAINLAENDKAVTTVAVSDDGPAKNFSLSGADAALFSISSSGALKFIAAPDFEAPKDAGRNNVYNVTVKVSDGTLTDTQALSITVKDVNGNSISGTSAGDRIDTTHKIGGLGATNEEDKISGKGGDDTIKGAGGNDTFKGGAGNDTLYGEAGKDQFVFDTKLGTTNIDTIKDFVHNEDLLALDNAIFTKIAGQLDAAEFHAKAGAVAAHDGNDRIVYDTSSGKLYYDDDGKGGHAAVHFATLSGKPVLDHGDFIIV